MYNIIAVTDSGCTGWLDFKNYDGLISIVNLIDISISKTGQKKKEIQIVSIKQGRKEINTGFIDIVNNFIAIYEKP